MTAIATPATAGAARPRPVADRRLGWLVAGSLLSGLVTGLLLATAPFTPSTEGATSGALLVGWSLGWGMLAVLTARFTDRPQSWALAPAVLMGTGGVVLVTLGADAYPAIGWVWPPALLALLVWLLVRVRQDLAGASRRWLVRPILALLLLTAVGGVYETASAALGAPRPPMPGTLVDVGGHRLHLDCTGSGSPTVILEAGGGEMSASFGWVAPAIAETTRVCAYDRAGRGWSDAATTRQDATQIATDLHALLQHAGVPGPYVLVGHSFGGRYVLTFADLFEADVAGLVLVDTTAPSSGAGPATDESAEPSPPGVAERIAALLSSTTRFGVGRLIARSDYGSLPPTSRDVTRASVATAAHVESTVNEYLQAGPSGRQAARVEDLGSMPLMVLTAGIGSSASWMDAQDRLAGLSDDSVHHVVDGASHAALLHEESHAATTTAAIREVVAAVRADRPLTDPA